jgi:hypothetical protein
VRFRRLMCPPLTLSRMSISCLVISGYLDVIILSFLYRSGHDLVKYPDRVVLDVALHCFVN